MEDIYIARSIRVSHTLPTQFCAQPKIGFAVANEDRFTFSSISTRPSDGRVVDANVRSIGTIHACLGQASGLAPINFYGEGRLGPGPFEGVGACRVIERDFPEQGLYLMRCFLALSGLPPGYVGGELTTSTLLSREVLGTETNPPGYVQSSIATIRLWKKRHEGLRPLSGP